MEKNSFDEFGKIKAPQEWVNAACARQVPEKKHGSALKHCVAIAACLAVAATGVWAYFRTQPAKQQPGMPQGVIEPISGENKITEENPNGEGGRGDSPIEAVTKPDDGKIFFSDDFSIPSASALNVFAYRQSDAASQLKSNVEKLFGIDSLVSTENSVDQFLDCRGTDKNGSNVGFQQNIVSGSFTYTATFSEESDRKYLENYSSINLEKMKPQLEIAAEKYAKEFESVTGELVLKSSQVIESGMFVDSKTYTYNTYEFTFVQKTPATVQAAAGISCSDMENGFFIISLRPDGEVIMIDSMLTTAALDKCGEEKMFSLEQLHAYLEREEEMNAEGEGTPNPARTVTACRIVYVNDHCVGRYVPGVVITYYFADKKKDTFEEYIPISFARDGI